MILQIDLKHNSVLHQWHFIDDIRKNTSYDTNKVKEAIENKKPYLELYWVEVHKQ